MDRKYCNLQTMPENLEMINKGQFACPKCGSVKVVCIDTCKGKFCRKNCWHGDAD